MLDLALTMRGRVQNFERDDVEVPRGKRLSKNGSIRTRFPGCHPAVPRS
jgi:hypothetical protein